MDIAQQANEITKNAKAALDTTAKLGGGELFGGANTQALHDVSAAIDFQMEAESNQRDSMQRLLDALKNCPQYSEDRKMVEGMIKRSRAHSLELSAESVDYSERALKQGFQNGTIKIGILVLGAIVTGRAAIAALRARAAAAAATGGAEVTGMTVGELEVAYEGYVASDVWVAAVERLVSLTALSRTLPNYNPTIAKEIRRLDKLVKYIEWSLGL